MVKSRKSTFPLFYLDRGIALRHRRFWLAISVLLFSLPFRSLENNERYPFYKVPTVSSTYPAVAPRKDVNFCRKVAKEFLSIHGLIGKGQTETVRKIYDCLIETVAFAPPVGFDIWRYRSRQQTIPTYVENRSISPLLFSTGSCEDFSAAMVILLEEADIPAYYVAGYTLSVNGHYTDHAWVVAQIDGDWYHFDPQLEQNVTQGYVLYRFFMKPDAVMHRDHLWGENLIAYVGNKATQEEIDRIRTEFTPPVCNTPGPILKSHFMQHPVRPDIRELERSLEAERQSHGLLPELHLNTDPPVLVAAQPLTESDPR